MEQLAELGRMISLIFGAITVIIVEVSEGGCVDVLDHGRVLERIVGCGEECLEAPAIVRGAKADGLSQSHCCEAGEQQQCQHIHNCALVESRVEGHVVCHRLGCSYTLFLSHLDVFLTLYRVV